MVSIEAREYDEAYSVLVNDRFEEALDEMIKEKRTYVWVEYGVCVPFEYKGSDDCEYQMIGEFEISMQELIDELGIDEVLDYMFVSINELTDENNDLKKQLRNCLKKEGK